MRLGKLFVRLAETEALGEHLSIEVTNDAKNPIFDLKGDKLKLRISMVTAAKLAEFIDEALEDSMVSYKKDVK